MTVPPALTVDAGPVLSVWAGEVVYEDAWRWQRRIAEARLAREIGDVLLSLTHDRVYTAGRHANVAANVLGTTGIRVVEVDRGGDVTYHGPGQLVVYPVLRLADRKAARPLVTALETALVRTLASYGVDAAPDPGRPGVWVGRDKVAAIGLRIDRGVTTHGLALNVKPALEDYAGLIPCGIVDGGVTSLARLGVVTTVAEARRRLVGHLAHALGRSLQPATPADLGLVAVAG